MEAVKVSVVIPVYNVEAYLPQCLDSIVGQTLQEIEILCVDDGSTDGSLRVLQEYADRDPRVRIYRQQNKFAGAARNTGLQHACGEYIIFWDGDDYFSKNALSVMYGLAKEHDADMVVCDAQDFDSETGRKIAHNYVRKPLPETTVFNIHTYKERIYDFTSTVCWNKLVRRSFLIEQKITFQEIKHINDVAATLQMLSLAERIVLSRKRLIHYRVNRSTSLMATYGEQTDAVMQAVTYAGQKLSEKGLFEDKEIRLRFLDKAAALSFFTGSYCGDIEAFRAYYAKIYAEDNILATVQDRPDLPKNLRQYVDCKGMSAEAYLFAAYKEQVEKTATKQQTVSELRSQVRQLKKELDAAEDRQTQQEEALQAVQKELAAVKEQLEQKKETVQTVQKELDENREELAAIKNSRIYRLLGKKE